ncbi:MAG: acyl-CoA-binding protein [Pseudomonadota bacterium]
MALDDDFGQAQIDAKALSARPSNENLLKLYAYFKQATEGDVQGERPGVFDFVGGAKYDAWSEIKGLTADDAKTAYVELVESLKS